VDIQPEGSSPLLDIASFAVTFRGGRLATLTSENALTSENGVELASTSIPLSYLRVFRDLGSYYCYLSLPSESDPSGKRVRRERMPARSRLAHEPVKYDGDKS
jgi:hypothetical protein